MESATDSRAALGAQPVQCEGNNSFFPSARAAYFKTNAVDTAKIGDETAMFTLIFTKSHSIRVARVSQLPARPLFGINHL
jgi:hypothetical protein